MRIENCFLWVTGVLLLSAHVALAAPPCQPGTLASYIALGEAGCVAGDRLFFDFAYGPGPWGTLQPPPPPPPPEAIIVTPGITDSPGLVFTPVGLIWQGFAWQVQQSASIGYSVKVLPGGTPIRGHGVAIKSYTCCGLGAIWVLDTVCLGGAFTSRLDSATCSTGQTGTVGVSAIEDPIADHEERVAFSPVWQVSVINELWISATSEFDNTIIHLYAIGNRSN
jgi:hypothetical protein